jgi:DNA-binding GntR family transcriptional regulator
VSPISPERVERLFEFRQIIEVGALRIALEAGADLSEVVAAAKPMETFDESTPWHTVIEVHNDIHRAIVAASGNPRLLDAYDRYRDDLQFMLAYLGRAHTVSTFAKNHLELADRIRKGAPEALESLEYDLSEFGVPPLLGALAELDTAKAGNDSRPSR